MLPSLRHISLLPCVAQDVFSIAVSASEHRLAAGGKSRNVVLYELRWGGGESAGGEGAPGEGAARASAGGAAASAEGESALAGGKLALVELLRVRTAGPVLTLALDAAGELLATAGEAKAVQLWGLERLTAAASATAAATAARPEAGDSNLGAQPRLGEAAPAGDAACRTPMSDDFDATFLCTSCVWSLSLTADGDMLAVGTNEHVEVYAIERLRAPAGAIVAAQSDDGAQGGGGSGGGGGGGGRGRYEWKPVLYLDTSVRQGHTWCTPTPCTLH